MSVLHDHVSRLTSAMFVGQTTSAEMYQRTLTRTQNVTSEQREHLASLEVLETLRGRIASTLDECERSETSRSQCCAATSYATRSAPFRRCSGGACAPCRGAR